MYSKIVLDSIEREKAGTDYFCTGKDKDILQALLEEINRFSGTQFSYLAELDAFTIPGSGDIIVQYIQRFSSESVKGYLLSQLVSDRIKDCDKIVLKMYMHFKASDEYISVPGTPAPAHIYTRYDNAFKKLNSKRIKNDLLMLAHNPRDVFYLPFTMRMLASWKIPELEELFLLYATASNITSQDIGISQNNDAILPPLAFIKRELRFIAIDALKYYPSDKTSEFIRKNINDSDPDISAAARKTLRILLRST